MISNALLRCYSLVTNGERSLHSAALLAAARKSTRAKRDALKKSKKVEEIKKVFIPYKKKLEMAKVGTISPRRTDEHKTWPPVDDVYFMDDYKWQVYSVAEAVALHRENACETQFNHPETNLLAHIELSMSADKKNKYIDEFSNIILLPHPYEISHKRTILVLCKDEEMTIKYRNHPGVSLVLGPEFMKMHEKGDLNFKDYDHIIAHVSLLPEMVTIRSALRKKMPSVKDQTAGTDLDPLIDRFYNGIQYNIIKDKYDHDFGSVDVPLGPLTYKEEELEENLAKIIVDIEEKRPPIRSKRLITLVNLRTKLIDEKFKIDHNKYLPPEEIDDEEEAAA